MNMDTLTKKGFKFGFNFQGELINVFLLIRSICWVLNAIFRVVLTVIEIIVIFQLLAVGQSNRSPYSCKKQSHNCKRN